MLASADFDKLPASVSSGLYHHAARLVDSDTRLWDFTNAILVCRVEGWI
jgi:hypothetical protein